MTQQRLAYRDRVLMFDLRADLVDAVPGLLGEILDEFIQDGVFSKDFVLDWLPLRLISAGRNIFLQEPGDHGPDWRTDLTQTVRDAHGRRAVHHAAQVDQYPVLYTQGMAVHHTLDVSGWVILRRSPPASAHSSGWSVVGRALWNNPDHLEALSLTDFETISVFEWTRRVGRTVSQVLTLPPGSAVSVDLAAQTARLLKDADPVRLPVQT